MHLVWKTVEETKSQQNAERLRTKPQCVKKRSRNLQKRKLSKSDNKLKKQKLTAEDESCMKQFLKSMLEKEEAPDSWKSIKSTKFGWSQSQGVKYACTNGLQKMPLQLKRIAGLAKPEAVKYAASLNFMRDMPRTAGGDRFSSLYAYCGWHSTRRHYWS